MKAPRGSLVETIVSAGFFCFLLSSYSIAQSKTDATPIAQPKNMPQTITFRLVPPQTAKSVIVLTATAKSGLPVAFASTTPAVCAVSGSAASLKIAGICVIRATQGGDDTFKAAPIVTQSFDVSPGKGSRFDIAREGVIIAPVRRPCPTPALDPQEPISPSTWIPGQTYELIVKGTGFTTVADSTKACPATVITIDVPTGTVTLTNMKVLNQTTMTATIKTSEDMPGQAATVTLWGPDPKASDEIDPDASLDPSK